MSSLENIRKQHWSWSTETLVTLDEVLDVLYKIILIYLGLKIKKQEFLPMQQINRMKEHTGHIKLIDL